MFILNYKNKSLKNIYIMVSFISIPSILFLPHVVYGLSKGIRNEMAVPFRHLGRPVTEEFSGNIKARAVHYHFACEHMP